MITIRGIAFEENLKNRMGLQFYDLSHPWGHGAAAAGRTSRTSRSSACTAWRSPAC